MTDHLGDGKIAEKCCVGGRERRLRGGGRRKVGKEKGDRRVVRGNKGSFERKQSCVGGRERRTRVGGWM